MAIPFPGPPLWRESPALTNHAAAARHRPPAPAGAGPAAQGDRPRRPHLTLWLTPAPQPIENQWCSGRFDPYRRSHIYPLFSRASDKQGINRPARIGTDMHGYAEKSCTKVAPFFPGTVLGLTAKIPQSAKFPRRVAAGAAPQLRISTRNPSKNGSNASPSRSKWKAWWITIPSKPEPSPPRAASAPSTRSSPVARPSCRKPSMPRLVKFTRCAQFT